MGDDKLCNCHFWSNFTLHNVANECWPHKSCPYSLVQDKQPFSFTLFVSLSDMLHTQSILLPFFKQENLCCKVRMTLIFFPAKITLLAGTASLWMVCSDFWSDFTRSSLSLHPRLIHYKCLQPVSDLVSACTAVPFPAAAIAVCCMSGSCFTPSTPLAIFLQWSAKNCWPPG